MGCDIMCTDPDDVEQGRRGAGKAAVEEEDEEEVLRGRE